MTDKIVSKEVQNLVDEYLIEELEKKNPWAICHAQGLKGDKFEKCVLAVKKQYGIKLSSLSS